MAGEAAFIGFGEAGTAFAAAGARGFDLKLADPAAAAAKRAEFAANGVLACASAAEAVAGAGVVLSVVTADQALAAARAAAAALAPGALWLDMNSVAPDTKRAAAAAIDRQGRYVDVAVMAPVVPAGLNVPLLVSGPHAAAGAAALGAAGFGRVRVVGAEVGRASAIKMIRSVMVKGMEVLSAECALAAEAAGVLEEVLASLDASERAKPWADRIDYNLDRMMVHGGRRAEEMAEVARTLDALGTGSAMSRAAGERQRAIGRVRVAPPAGLTPKLRALLPFLTRLEDAA